MKNTFFRLFVIVVLLGIGEAACLVALRFIPAHVYYKPPSDADIKAYHELMTQPNYSSTLGWLPQPELVTEAGTRISPGGEGYVKIASVYGDSFAYGNDVGHDEAWTDVLSRLLKRRVDNYGVNFYSTGQALLRFIENTDDKPEIVILVVMSENIVRNINQNTTFIYSPQFMFRPVWYLKDEGISWEPIPYISGMDAETYLAQERDLLRHEYFWPESTNLSKRKIGFPYLYSLPRAILLNSRITYGLLDELGFHVGAWYRELYDPQHPSGAFELTLRICEKFVEVARARGVKRPIVLFLPRDRDIFYFRTLGQWGYESFCDAAFRRLPEFYTLTDNIKKDFANKDDRTIKDYFSTSRFRWGRSQREVGGHYSVEGNAYLAQVVREIILNR